MKNFILLPIFLFSSLLPAITFAQQKQDIYIELVKQNNNTVEFTLVANTPFYVGGNVYVLHIGDKNFHLSQQDNDDKNRGYLKFFIPLNEFAELKDGSTVYLTYGYLDVTAEQDVQTLYNNDPAHCWVAGKFNKTQLTK